MEILELLGFTTTVGVLWNSVAYIAFIFIIVAVFSKQYRNIMMTSGAGTLALYAWFFLHNPLFATLQLLITASGLMQLLKFSRIVSVLIVITLTATAYFILYKIGVLTDVWSVAGSIGLLGIAFGLVALPHYNGFLFMAVGGALLVVYAFYVSAWVFFILNIFFFLSSLYEWNKGIQNSTQDNS